MSWAKHAWRVLMKDMRTELRGRTALGTLILFAVVSITAVSYSLGGFGLTTAVQAALLWIVLFFAAMAGLARSFVAERETGTDLALRLSAPGSAVYLGKFLLNLLLLFILDILVIILFQILLPLGTLNWTLFMLGLGLGSVALASSSTLIAAIVAQTNIRGALFTVLAFPVLLPALIAGIAASRKALDSTPLAEATGELQLLVSYAGIMITVALMLFDYVWEE